MAQKKSKGAKRVKLSPDRAKKARGYLAEIRQWHRDAKRKASVGRQAKIKFK